MIPFEYFYLIFKNKSSFVIRRGYFENYFNIDKLGSPWKVKIALGKKNNLLMARKVETS